MRGLTCILWITCFFCAAASFADPSSDTALKSEVKELRTEVEQLKKKLETLVPPSPPNKGLKTQDLHGETADHAAASPTREATSASNASGLAGSLPPELLKELTEQLKSLQKTQAESQKFLNELMKDNP